MKNRVITISREFGSGGRTIGKAVAEQLGIPCYDNEILQEIARESGATFRRPENMRRAAFWQRHFLTRLPAPATPTVSGRCSTS